MEFAKSLVFFNFHALEIMNIHSVEWWLFGTNVHPVPQLKRVKTQVNRSESLCWDKSVTDCWHVGYSKIAKKTRGFCTFSNNQFLPFLKRTKPPTPTPNFEIKNGPRWPKMAQHGPTWPQDGPRWAQDGPRWPQNGPEIAQDGPKMPQDTPRCSKVAPS